jgi:DUF4097 and DUF4098 domain-containing protein YvlB
MKKGLIITAAILTALGILIFVGALFASGFDLSKLGTVSYETNVYTVNGSFDVIEIDSSETDVTFKRSEDTKLRVECVERRTVKHNVKVENGVLTISEDDKRLWYEHFSLFTKDLRMTVYLPSQSYDSLVIDSGTGDVTVPADFSFGGVSIKVSTGDVVLKASVGGEVKIKSGTGNITLEGVNAEAFDLSSSTGNIEIASAVCDGAISIDVSTGKVRLSDVRCESFITDGSTGAVWLNDVIASDGMKIERSTGKIRFEGCDAGEITAKTSTGSVSGTLLSDKVFIAKSSTGSVRVPDTTSGGRCEITTSTGSIDIEIKK